MNNEYKTVCDKCGKKTWYEKEQQCHMEYLAKRTCKHCGHSETLDNGKMTRCPGTLKIIDNSNLNPLFTVYYNNGNRIEVKSEWGEIKRGTIGKTTGWKPSYLLMPTKRSTGSSFLIGKNDKILKVIN